jgi:hypothetical protein
MKNKPLKIDRKRKPELVSIVLLIFTLVIMLVVLSQIKKNMPESNNNIPALPEGQKVGILDSLYLNFQHYFSIKRPSQEWEFEKLQDLTVPQKADTLLPLYPQIDWLLKLTNLRNAETAFGVIEWPSRLLAKDVTTSILSELLQQYETFNQRARIIVPLDSPAHRVLQGAFTVVLFPENEKLKYPLWLIAVLPRDSLGYIIISKTTEKSYALVKDDFEKIISDFTAISKSVFD